MKNRKKETAYESRENKKDRADKNGGIHKKEFETLAEELYYSHLADLLFEGGTLNGSDNINREIKRNRKILNNNKK